MDGLYFGKRTNSSSWCLIVFRDSHDHENLWWKFTKTESTSAYREGREDLERLGYFILSVTGDGFGGIRSAFSGIPFQMCLVHMERLIIRGTTRRPQTEPGVVLLALARSLHKTSKETFLRRFLLYWRKYQPFLYEKTVHPNGDWSWSHEELRRATLSVRRLIPYLFTYEKDSGISKTSNSIEGHFSHIRDLMRVHRGLSKKHQERVLCTILLNSSVVLEKERKR